MKNAPDGSRGQRGVEAGGVKGLVSLVLVLVAALAPSPARSQQERADPAISKELDAAYARFGEAYRTSDAAAVAGVYAEDAFYLAPGADVRRGREAILSLFEGFLGELPPGAFDVAFTILERETSGDLAYDIGYYDLTVARPGEEASRSRGKFVVVWKREADGEWRIQADGYSGVEPD